MKKSVIFPVLLVISLWSVPSFGAGISADDFLPPVQADSPQAEAALEQVNAPDAVKQDAGVSGQPAIVANSAQDAINASSKNMQSNANWVEVGGGVQEIKFPSGFGFVASGVATYSPMPNPTANLIAQRNAYQIAYMNAKKNLAGYLNELSSSAKEKLLNEYKTLITDSATLANVSQTNTENLNEFIKGLLKGYVVYKVSDTQNDGVGEVTVTIVSTPKTLAKTNRVTASSLTSDNIRNGLNEVLAELSTGLLPPLGGKVINIPQTGELAFVGFGSAVVPDNPDKGVQAKLALNAQKVSQMRARSALCGIILGDEIEASASHDQVTQSMSKQFEELQAGDPTNGASSNAEINRLEEQVKSFVNTQLSTDQISSMRKGVLPPGVNTKTFMNPEKTIAQSISVYVPSVSANAARANRDMQNATIMKNPTQGSNSGSAPDRPAQMPPQGPTGQVSNDADL